MTNKVLLEYDGRKWTENNLKELIDACAKYQEFKDFLNHYF